MAESPSKRKRTEEPDESSGDGTSQDDIKLDAREKYELFRLVCGKDEVGHLTNEDIDGMPAKDMINTHAIREYVKELARKKEEIFTAAQALKRAERARIETGVKNTLHKFCGEVTDVVSIDSLGTHRADGKSDLYIWFNVSFVLVRTGRHHTIKMDHIRSVTVSEYGAVKYSNTSRDAREDLTHHGVLNSAALLDLVRGLLLVYGVDEEARYTVIMPEFKEYIPSIVF